MFGNKDVNGVFVMPKDVLKYMGNAKKIELKVLLYLFANLGSFSVDEAAEELSESRQAVENALSYWRGTGIVVECDNGKQENKESLSLSDNQKAGSDTQDNRAVLDKIPEKGYSTLEIAHARKNDKDFSHLVDYVESVTGELLNSAKQGDLLYLYDNLGMQCDVIMGITAHCVEEDKRKLRYIVKTAEGIHNDGVRSYKELESYFAAKQRYKDYSFFVKKLIGAAERAFTPGEEKTVKRWESELCIPKELVEYAYERTISLIAKPSLPYMSKIIETWHNEGIDTLEKAKAQNEKNGENRKIGISEKAKKAGFDFNLDDIFEKP